MLKFLVDEKVNGDKYYLVGYCPKLDKYVLACVVTWIAWYNRYYELTKEEYDSFGSENLDKLAENLYRQGMSSERFLFSDKKEENDENQLILRNELWRQE